jgi:predicted negative regulator of RcsB-dependent stress response
MANHLDLEEQEQLDQIKHFWNQYGNAITWVLIGVLAAIAAWNGYQYWQRSQAAQASALYDELERVAATKDAAKLDRAFGEMKDRFASTAYAQQAALLVAKVDYETANIDGAKAALAWAMEKASDKGIAAIARLRYAGLLLDTKAYDDALKALNAEVGVEFAGLYADRRGDIQMAQGKKQEAKQEYLKAFKGLDERENYRRIVEVKLNALGVNPQEGGK